MTRDASTCFIADLAHSALPIIRPKALFSIWSPTRFSDGYLLPIMAANARSQLNKITGENDDTFGIISKFALTAANPEDHTLDSHTLFGDEAHVAHLAGTAVGSANSGADIAQATQLAIRIANNLRKMQHDNDFAEKMQSALAVYKNSSGKTAQGKGVFWEGRHALEQILHARYDIGKQWQNLKEAISRLPDEQLWPIWINWYEWTAGLSSEFSGPMPVQVLEIYARLPPGYVRRIEKGEFATPPGITPGPAAANWWIMAELEKIGAWPLSQFRQPPEPPQSAPPSAMPDRNPESRDFFLSYSTKDVAIAQEVVEVVEAAGFSIIAQYKDFPTGSNFVTEMQKGMARSKRVICLYSSSYLDSTHCMAEWNFAYAKDADGENRTLVPFLLETIELKPLMRQVVYTSLVGLKGQKRRDAILKALQAEPRHRSKNETKPILAANASPNVVVTKGKLDARPNPTIDVAVAGPDLANLPRIQVSIADGLLESLTPNTPLIVRASLKIYRSELALNGANPVLGILSQQATILLVQYQDRESDLWTTGQTQAWDFFFGNHNHIINHFPLNQQREQLLTEIPIEEETASGPALRDPLMDVAEALEPLAEAGFATDDFTKYVKSLPEQAAAVDTPVPPDLKDTTVTPKRRFVLSTIGFLERATNALSSALNIASSPQGQAMSEAMRKALDALLNFLRLP